MMRFKLGLPILFVLLLPRGAAHAVDYYVAKTGSDGNPCSLSQPCLTIGHGVTLLGADATLHVGPGTYAEGLNDSIPSGTSGHPATLVASDALNRPVIQPSSGDRVLFMSNRHDIAVDGFILDGAHVAVDGVKLTTGTTRVTLRNSEVKNAPEQGILLSGGSDSNVFYNLTVHDNGTTDFHHGIYCATSSNTIDHSEFYRNSGWGIHIYDGSVSPSVNANVVSNCTSHDNARIGQRGAGVGVYVGSDNVVVNCRVWGNNGGILSDYGAVNPKIENNTVVANGGADGSGRTGIYVGVQTSGAIVKNNIVALNLTTGIWSDSLATTTLSNNLTYGNAADGLHTTGTSTTATGNLIGANPLLADVSSHDYRLQAGSPAIDAGVALSETTPDPIGTTRPQGSAYDLGAFEYAGAPSPTGTPFVLTVSTCAVSSCTVASDTQVLSVLYTPTGAVSVPLPAAAARSGRVLVIKDMAGGAGRHPITLTRAGSDLINGSPTLVISGAYGSVRIVSDGISRWGTF